jgi:hypothetical protein
VWGEFDQEQEIRRWLQQSDMGFDYSRLVTFCEDDMRSFLLDCLFLCIPCQVALGKVLSLWYLQQERISVILVWGDAILLRYAPMFPLLNQLLWTWNCGGWGPEFRLYGTMPTVQGLYLGTYCQSINCWTDILWWIVLLGVGGLNGTDCTVWFACLGLVPTAIL